MRPTGFSRLLRPYEDGAAVGEGLDEAAGVVLGLRLDAVVMGGAVELPSVEDERLALVDAGGDGAVPLDPVRDQETQR